jgi:FkbM family methyltransferase
MRTPPPRRRRATARYEFESTGTPATVRTANVSRFRGVTVNVVERMVDNVDPSVSARLRALKKWWERDQIRQVMTMLARPGTVAVDIGANRGVYTFMLSSRVGPFGRVHSVEPYQGNAARLQTLAKRRGNVTFYPVAVSDQTGEAMLRVPLYRGRRIDALATLGSVLGTGYDQFRVPVRTLDDLLRKEKGRITFLKCDVEGHEDHVLRGAAGTLREHMPAIVIEIEQRHRREPIEETFSYLLGLGYVGYFLTPPGPRPFCEFDAEQFQAGAFTSGFVAYRMPEGYVSDFLFVAPGNSLGRHGWDRSNIHATSEPVPRTGGAGIPRTVIRASTSLRRARQGDRLRG